MKMTPEQFLNDLREAAMLRIDATGESGCRYDVRVGDDLLPAARELVKHGHLREMAPGLFRYRHNPERPSRLTFSELMADITVLDEETILRGMPWTG